MSLAEAATFLAAQWPVFACDAQRRPVTAHGFKDATQDVDAIRAMFRTPGAALIGVPTGTASDLVVIDLDVKRGAPGLEWLAANEHRLPETRQHTTQSGGRHLLFRYPVGRMVRNSQSKLAPGVDVRGEGGYVIMPPSPGYAIHTDAMPAAIPLWLLELLDPPEAPRQPAPARDWRHGTGRGSPYGLTALSDEVDAICNAPWGQQEHTLNSAALKIGALVAGGEIEAAYARETLIAAGLGMRNAPGERPWTGHEIARKVERGMADGARSPRAAPALPAPQMRHSAPAIAAPAPAAPADEAAPETASGPLWVDEDDWTPDAIPKRPWIAPGFLLRGSVTMLSGAGGGGKSSLVVRWTIALALGEPAGEFRPAEAMAVVNYNVEDDKEEQRRRYSAALQLLHRAPADLGKRVIRCGPETIGTLFAHDPQTGAIHETPAMQRLEWLITNKGASVLVCDPLAELHTSEENDNTAMRAVIASFRQLAKRLNIAILLLHHDRKGHGAAGDIDRMRGAGAIAGAIRVGLTLTTMNQEEAEQFGIPADQRRQHFRLDGAKSNYAPASDAEWWRLEGVEIGNGESVAACAPWSPPSTFAGHSMADCIAMLETIARGTPEGFAYAAHKQAGEDWAGTVITARGATEAQAKAMLNAWRNEQTITITSKPSPRNRQKRQAIEVNAERVAEMRHAEARGRKT